MLAAKAPSYLQVRCAAARCVPHWPGRRGSRAPLLRRPRPLATGARGAAGAPQAPGGASPGRRAAATGGLHCPGWAPWAHSHRGDGLPHPSTPLAPFFLLGRQSEFQQCPPTSHHSALALRARQVATPRLLGGAAANRHSKELNLVCAVIAAGLYPNIALARPPAKGKGGAVSFFCPRDGRSLATEKVSLHRDSVNYGATALRYLGLVRTVNLPPALPPSLRAAPLRRAQRSFHSCDSSLPAVCIFWAPFSARGSSPSSSAAAARRRRPQ